MFFIFADLEKAFDWTPREVIRFALRRKGVPEYLLNGVMSLYKGCKTAVSVDGEQSSSFSLKVGIHQGSALSLLLSTFGCSDRRCEGWFINGVVVADDLVLCREVLNEVMDKHGKWKNAVEGKGLRVNVDQTEGMQLLFGKRSSVSKVDPCGVCGEQVCCNSI